MTQNLLVANDPNSDIVKFDVLLPDNYSSFKIDYLNGAVINQNYFKVGDTIKFEFSNNPIVYDDVRLKIRIIHANGSEYYLDRQHRGDSTPYEFIQLNLMNYYRVAFLPIYEFWDQRRSSTLFLINPCDEQYILDEPVKAPEAYIYNRNPNPASNLRMSFTGKYVIAFRTNIDKIPDLEIKIGESISNTKQRPEELGNYAVSSGVVNELTVQQVQSAPYNYGADWTYPISNLLINHKETIVYVPKDDSTEVLNVRLAYAALDNLARPITQDVQLNNFNISEGTYHSSIQNSSQTLIFKNYNGLTFSDLTADINTGVAPIEPVSIPICELSGGKYINVYPPDGQFMVKGEEMAQENLFYIDVNDNLTIKSLDPQTSSFINPAWYYTGKSLRIQCFTRADETQPWSLVVSSDHEDDYLYIIGVNNVESKDSPVLIHFKDYDINLPLFGQWRNKLNDQAVGDPVEVCFKIFIEASGEFEYEDNIIEDLVSNPPTFVPFAIAYITGYILTDETGAIPITSMLNTGLTPAAANYAKTLEWQQNEPVQLSNTKTITNAHARENDEDILLKRVDKNGKPGINISQSKLNNNIHVINEDGTVDIKPLKWRYSSVLAPDHATDKEVLVFIPRNSSRPLTPFYRQNYVSGWFELTDSDGNLTTELLDNKTDCFLATNHSTLNIDPPASDDLKYKTFNGSLNFDRSNARITRLFSNDTTGSALNYLNDLLAAKLSRYYYAADFRTYDSFFATNKTLILNANHRTMFGYYRDYDLYTGEHSVLLSNCGDIVKLLGSENLVNNCFSMLSPEEQSIATNPLTYKEVLNDGTVVNRDPSLFVYKFFHFYNSGTISDPYLGYSVNDTETTTIGGVNSRRVDNTKTVIMSSDSTNQEVNLPIINSTRSYYVVNKAAGGAQELDNLKLAMKNTTPYSTNRYLDDLGMIETLPAFRIYRNANFEQSDLTITTGGVKTLHPIYLQSTPRVCLNNLIYYFDFLINELRREERDNPLAPIVGFSSENIYDYFTVLAYNNSMTALLRNTEKPILRFAKTKRNLDFQGGDVFLAASLDSAFIMNYVMTNTINDYYSTEELKDSLPSKDNAATTNEEVIANFVSSSPYTNVQMFGRKTFDFFAEADELGVVQFKTQYVDTIDFQESLVLLYVDDKKKIPDVSSYVGNIAGYNNLKTCKIFIPKLGEFTQYAHILYLTSESFNKSLNVAIDYLNMSKYKSGFTKEMRNSYVDDGTQQQVMVYDEKFNASDKQKINVYLFGVMFKFHQLSLGWANLANEITDEFQIDHALGNKHFILTLYDDFGRTIPNTDTSQGFRNNLTIELSLV